MWDRNKKNAQEFNLRLSAAFVKCRYHLAYVAAVGDFMASLPYVTATGNISKALEGIKAAAVPDRVSQDFVKTILKVGGGSGDQMTTFLKKIGFTAPNGAPTELYKTFRNASSSKAAVATAVRAAYAPLYKRNEFMHKLSDEQLKGLLVEETGQPEDSAAVRYALGSIKALKALASFDEQLPAVADESKNQQQREGQSEHHKHRPNLGLNLGYTINLNLPATSDPKVFDAIFKSLKEHLLREDDA